MIANVRTRAAMLASFYAASRVTRAGEPLRMNAATAAGMLLHLGGTTRAALEMAARMPGDGPWPLAGRYLAELFDAEGADTVPPERCA